MNPANRERLRQAYEKARSSPEDDEAVGQLGMMLQALGEHRLAGHCYVTAAQLEPKAFRWIYYLGVVKAAEGEYSQAADLLRKALRLKPGFLPGRLKLAEASLAAANLDESEAVYQSIISEFPDSAAAYYGLGRIQAAKGQFTSAIGSLRGSCTLFPEFGAAYYALGIVYRDRGQLSEAQRLMSLFQLHKGSHPPLRDPLLDAIDDLNPEANGDLAEGLRLLEEGRNREAVPKFELALRKDSHSAQAYANLLSAYLGLGDLGKAEKAYQAAIKLDPNLYEACYNYGLLLMRQGRADDAAEAFRRALEINPFYAEAHNDLAYILAQQGNLEEAARHFRSAIENKPNFRDAHCNLGQIELARGRTQPAIEQLLQARTREDEKTAVCMFSLAKAYFLDGRSGEAEHYAKLAKHYASSLGQASLVHDIDELLKHVDRQP